MGYNRKQGDSKRKKKKVKHSDKNHKHQYNDDRDEWNNYIGSKKREKDHW